MENTRVYRDRQELTADDLNLTQQYTRDSLDHVVNDAVVNGNPAYWGFTVTKTAATQVTVSPGRYYSAIGAVYPVLTDTVLDLFNNLPLVTQKYVAIVTWGSTALEDVEPRDFLINATTGTTEPQSQAMESSRIGNLAIVAGIEAPQPSFPTVSTTVTVVAYVLINTTGVVSIQQFADTQLRNLAVVEAEVEALDLWQSQVNGQIDSLGTALANLSAKLKGYATEVEMQGQTAQLNALINYVYGTLRPPTNPYIFYGKNYFLDNTGSDVGNGSWSATLGEGIHFPAGATATSTLALLNSLDPNAAVNSGYMIPAYTNARRISCTGYSSELQISAFPFQSSLACRLLGRRRRRHRYGCMFQPNRSSDWWKTGGYDPVASTLAFDSESFGALTITEYIETVNPLDPWAIIGQYLGCRRNFFWEDYYSERYWDRVVVNSTVSGQQIAQTFVNSQDGWLTQVGLFFTRLGASGDVDIKICSLNSNTCPDLDNILTTVNVPFADLRGGILGTLQPNGPPTGPTLVETQVPIPPTFLAAGKRYAIVVTTAGQHYHACSTVDQLVLQGNHWYRDSSGLFVVNITRDLRLNLYYAKFDRCRYDIQLRPLQLAGGMTGIDVLAEAEVPSACGLSFQVQLNNVWYPLDVQGAGPDLSTGPALLPFRAVFTGTTDLMPGLGLTHSQVKLQRAGTSLAYFSTSTALGSPANNIKVTTVLEGFSGGTHTCVTKLHENSNTHTPDTVTDTTLPDGSLQRDSVFNMSGVAASQTITFSLNPSNNDTVTIGGTVVTFKTSSPSGNQVLISAVNLAGTLVSLAAFLNTSLDASISKARYSASATVLTVTYKIVGTEGNAFTTAASAATAGGATLTGGVNATAISSYTIEIDGTTSSANSLFHVAEKDEYAKLS